MQEEDHPINAKGWVEVYPALKERQEHPLEQITVQELGNEIDKGAIAGKDYLVVDVRRSDCLSMIPGAINLPAHSLNVAMPTLLQLLKPIPLVIFHCNQSKGRGPRAAGWYADALQAHATLSDESISKRVRILQGGIVAWEEHFGKGSLERRGKQEGKLSVQL